jgi:hypothetical protein
MLIFFGKPLSGRDGNGIANRVQKVSDRAISAFLCGVDYRFRRIRVTKHPSVPELIVFKVASV